jgi:hypothetical protein
MKTLGAMVAFDDCLVALSVPGQVVAVKRA